MSFTVWAQTIIINIVSICFPYWSGQFDVIVWACGQIIGYTWGGTGGYEEDKWGWVAYGSLVYKVLMEYGDYVEFTPMNYPQLLGSHKS